MSSMGKFAERLQQINETLEKRAVAALEQAKQRQREEEMRLRQLTADTHVAALQLTEQGTGADWTSMHQYLEALRGKQASHRQQVAVLTDAVEQHRLEVLSVHHQALKWARAVEQDRTRAAQERAALEAKQVDDLVSTRWQRREES
jgi:flagellar export protein FliJ